MAAVTVPAAPMSPSNSAPDEAPLKMEEIAHKEALTPPASEENNNRARSNSDLSDLNMEDCPDMDPIEPDHYFGGGKIPVFKPTMEQFKDFKKFVDKVDTYGMKSGIVKIIPPDEWRNNLPALDEMIKTIKVKNPIQQEFHGSQGTWTQANMEKQRTYNLPQWRALCEESNHQPPARRGERRRNQDTARASRASTSRASKTPAPAPATGKRSRGRPKKAPVKSIEDVREDSQGPESESQDPGTPGTPAPESSNTRTQAGSDDEKAPKSRGRQPKSVSSRRLRNKGEQNDVVDEESFKDFDYRIHDQDQWTIERCKELETSYWKSLTFNNPMYGADMPGSLFDDEKTACWNVAKLPNLLDVLGQKVPGVNTAYLYLGMWKATFAWHLEDVDLYSINYIHFGAPKQWYSISQEDARRFEKAMQTIWPNDAKNCDQFLRHKTYLISPQLLKSQFNIEVNRLVHHEGEFVITYPYGYHSGYNLGYNCAESVNFANEAWLEYGKVAKKCNCESDSVWVDVYDIERRMRGEKTPEYYETDLEEEDGDDEEDPNTALLTPPGSVKSKPAAKKRKRDLTDKGDKSKVKKIRIKISAPAKEPCCLCPHNPPFEPLLPTDTGAKAHRRCASYTPETRIAEVNGVNTICDIGLINKARLDLKCNHCRSKRGSVFQCSQKKCTRAYHATCAAAAGVQVDSGLVPVFLEDGSEYTEYGHDFRCRFHRVRRSKYNNDLQACIAALEDDSLIRKTAKHLNKGDLVQSQHFLGDIVAGYVLQNRRSDETLLIETYPSKDHFEIDYKWLLVLDPEQSQRPKPSPDAKPLPIHLLTSSKTNEDPASEVPKMDENFDTSDEFKWAEFHSSKPSNTEKLRVDLAKSKQLWHYIGPTSTEAKAQYTSNPANKQHDPSSNFLETVRPAPSRPAPPRNSMGGPYPSGVNTNALNAVRATWNMHYQRPAPGYNPAYNPAQHPYGQRPPHFSAPHIDANALSHQRTFQQSAGRTHQHPEQFAPLQRGTTVPEGMPTGRPELVRPPSQPSLQIDGVRRWTQEAFQPLRAPASGGRQILPTLQPRQVSPPSGFTMSPPSRPVFSRSPSAQPPKANLLTPPTTSDSNSSLRHRSDSLKALEKWPYLHETASKRPSVYVSPYTSNGYNESALTAEAPQHLSTTPQMRSRSTSLMQDFLSKASPHARELVRGHARTISTDKAAAKSREAERRMSESIQRQARLSGGNMSPIDMSEGLLGPDFGRPGSSSVISDRASPFPDFNMNSSTHTHPTPSQPASETPALGITNIPATSNDRNRDSSGVVGLSNLLNLQTATLESAIRTSQPGRTLNHHQPDIYYSTADQFSAHLQQVSAQYPMGTRPSSYNNYMRDLHMAATGDLHLKQRRDDSLDASKSDKAHHSVGEPGNSSFQPLHGYSVMQGLPKTLVSPADIRRAIEAEQSGVDRRVSPPPPPTLGGIDNDIAVDDSLVDFDHDESEKLKSPLKEGFGNGTLPTMGLDAFVNDN